MFQTQMILTMIQSMLVFGPNMIFEIPFTNKVPTKNQIRMEAKKIVSSIHLFRPLNVPLGNEHQFQPVAPPIVEAPNHTLGQKPSIETISPVVSMQNETLSTTVAPKPVEKVEPVQAQSVTTAAPLNIDLIEPIESPKEQPIVVEEFKPIHQQEEEKLAIKPIVDEVKSILEKHNTPQQPIDATHQKIIKEEIIVAAHRETVTVAESVKPAEVTPEPKVIREPVNQSDPVQPAVVKVEQATVPEEEQPPVVEAIPTTTVAPMPESKVEATLTTPKTPPRVLRSTTTRFQQKAQAARQRQMRSKNEPENITDEAVPPLSEEKIAEPTQAPEIPVQTSTPTVEVPLPVKPVETIVETVKVPEIPVQPSTPTVEIPTPATPVETTRAPEIVTPVTPVENLVEATNVSDVPAQTLPPTIEIPTPEDIDYPRQVHVHDTKTLLHAVEEQEQKKESLTEQLENNTTSNAFLSHDHTSHLPRILENADQPITTTMMMTTQADHSIHPTEASATAHVHSHLKDEETNKSAVANATGVASNGSDTLIPTKLREVCWSLPKPVHPTLDLLENQMLGLVGFLPEFVQTIFFARLDNPEVVLNTLWFASICVVCFFFSLFFLTMATNRLRQSHDEKAIRARCQQLQQDFNQLELERATFERQNQK